MEKIIMIIEKSKDFFDAYSDNCDGIYAAGDSIEAVKADAMEAISLIKKNLPEDRIINGLHRFAREILSITLWFRINSWFDSISVLCVKSFSLLGNLVVKLDILDKSQDGFPIRKS